MHPSEALKTNMIGTHHALEVAVKDGVSRLVNISTDKATSSAAPAAAPRQA
jgi:UDP-N-acetylglucosamine 4,6-dehydratase